MAFNFLEQLNKIKTPGFLKPYAGELLFKPESEVTKQFFGVGERPSTLRETIGKGISTAFGGERPFPTTREEFGKALKRPTGLGSLKEQGEALKAGKGLTPERQALVKNIQPIIGGMKIVGPKSAQILGAERVAMARKAIEKRAKDLTQKVINALKEAKPLRKGQEAIYTQFRGQKLAKSIAVGKKVTGEKGFYAEKGALKGKLPRVQFESIRRKIGQRDIDNLFNQVKESPLLSVWDKITAREGLAKLFGSAGGQVPTKGELSLLKDVFGSDLVKTVLGKRTLLQKMGEAGYQLANIPRSIMTAFDVSAPFRQGLFTMARHPKIFFSAFAKQFKMFGSEKAYKALNDEILSRPTAPLMRKNRLALTELGSALTKREEAFMSGWAEKIPLVGRGIRASGRAYTGFLNKVRADIFDYMVKRGSKLAIKDPKFLKDAANFINAATGRGGLGFLEKASVPLNTFFFSPRLMSSRLNLINPIYYAKLHPTVRREALESLFAFAGTALTVAGLMKMGGAEIELDPRNADFMKPKFGNVRYDILGGFQQPIRLAAQLISGKIISSTTGKTITLGEGYKPLTRIDIAQRYLEYKQSPLVSFAWSLLEGQTAIGEKVDIPTEVANRFIPMVVQDMYDLFREKGLEGIPMAFPAIFGVGVQSYGGVESYGLEGRKYTELNKELNTLKATIGFPSTQAFGQELSNKEYKELKKVSGEMIADALTEIIADESYKKLSDNEKKQLINKVVDKTKTAVKEKLFLDKKLQNELKKRLMEKGMDEEKAKKTAKEIYEKEINK